MLKYSVKYLLIFLHHNNVKYILCGWGAHRSCIHQIIVQLEKIFLCHFYDLAKLLKPCPHPSPHPCCPRAGLGKLKNLPHWRGGKLAMVGMFVLCVVCCVLCFNLYTNSYVEKAEVFCSPPNLNHCKAVDTKLFDGGLVQPLKQRLPGVGCVPP